MMMMMIIIIIISIIVPLALWSRPRRQSRHEHSQCPYSTANLRTNIMDFRGFWIKHNHNSKGWNSQAHRWFPGKFGSSNLSRDNASREIVDEIVAIELQPEGPRQCLTAHNDVIICICSHRHGLWYTAAGSFSQVAMQNGCTRPLHGSRVLN